MSRQRTIDFNGESFAAQEAQTILEAAKVAGVDMPHGCQVGACRVCRTKLKKGHVAFRQAFSGHLTDEEVANGYILPCCAIATTDVEITSESAIKINKEGVIVHEKTVFNQVIRLKLKTSKISKLAFFPGQYIAIDCGKGQYRNYSIANQPKIDGYIEIHVRKRPDGVFSEHLCRQLNEGDVLWIKGPLGESPALPSSKKHLILMATGTGFAPVQAILLSELATQYTSIRCYWGGRIKSDLYFSSWLEVFRQRYPNFTFIPSLSQPLPNDKWTGYVGYVQTLVLADHEHFNDHAVYACGSQAMIEEAYQQLTQSCDLPIDCFHADTFYVSPSLG